MVERQRIRLCFTLLGATDAPGMARAVWDALHSADLSPSRAENILQKAIIKGPGDFQRLWTAPFKARVHGALQDLTGGARWSRRKNPQGRGSISHQTQTNSGQRANGTLTLDHILSPKVDWIALFQRLCTQLEVITGTIDLYQEARRLPPAPRALPIPPAKRKIEPKMRPISSDEASWGTFDQLPWGFHLGPLWRAEIHAELAAAGCERSPAFYSLTPSPHDDPQDIQTARDALTSAMPQLLWPNKGARSPT